MRVLKFLKVKRSIYFQNFHKKYAAFSGLRISYHIISNLLLFFSGFLPYV